MNLSGVLPRLVGTDTLYTIKTYSEVLADRLEGGTAWTTLPMGSGWTAVAGYAPQARKFGKMVEIRGMAKFVSGVYTNTICTVPAAMAPNGQNAWLQTTIGSVSRGVAQPFCSTAGAVSIPAGTAYVTVTPAANDQFVLKGFWHTDNV